MSTTWIPFFLVLLTAVTTTGSDPDHQSSPSIAILYNSESPDGNFQLALFNSVLIGLRDAYAESNVLQRPLFMLVDLSEFEPKVTRDWIIENGTLTLISLLSSNQLKTFCDLLAVRPLKQTISIFTPRNLPDEAASIDSFIKIRSLQMSLDGRIMALLHRIMKVGTEKILPVLDNPSQLLLLRKYQEISSRVLPELEFLSPIFLSQPVFWTSHPSFPAGTGNGTGVGHGVLLLSEHGINPEAHRKLVEQDHFFQWFSHEAIHEWDARSSLDMLGLYSVQFVGTGNWDNPQRRKLLKEFNLFTGPNPTILSVVLAYDTATVAMKYLRTGSLPSSSTGLSGDIQFNNRGTRTHGVYFGMFTLSKTKGSFASVLQHSDWMLEDLIEVNESEGILTFGEYQLATSSIISRQELLHVAKRRKGFWKCDRVKMEVKTQDTFNQMEYRYTFDQRTLPQHIIIPNQYGYGLQFRCHRKASPSITTLDIACTPNGKSSGEPVHCFKSPLSTRSKRSLKSFRAIYPKYSSPYSRVSAQSPREDNSMMTYNVPPLNSYYNGYSGNNDIDSSTPATMTTRLDVPINEDPPPPPSAGAAKIPELRQILKAAKPFVGSCIGSTAGCSVCVLVLGRLPLGAIPAACTGPCFVGTFGTCGSLLGRVFSETTVICTELFRQGLLDVDTFLADAEFGRRMAIESPQTLLGYQVIATPLVEKMKVSESLTKFVAFFALPWTKHMKYVIGKSEEFSWSGYFIHTVGCWFCSFLGNILSCLNVSRTVESLGYSVGGVVIGLILIIKQFKNDKGKRK